MSKWVWVIIAATILGIIIITGFWQHYYDNNLPQWGIIHT